MSGTVRPDSNGRLPDGRFGPTNRFGGGNPCARRMYELRRSILEATTPEMVRGVVEKLALAALSGDTTAARLFLEYTVGRVPQAIELSGGESIGANGPALVAIILQALARHPEARQSVLTSLKGLGDGGDDAGDA